MRWTGWEHELLGHPDWAAAEIRIFAAFPESQIDQQRDRLLDMITSGRLPMSPSASSPSWTETGCAGQGTVKGGRKVTLRWVSIPHGP